jgi:hypothetical protein
MEIWEVERFQWQLEGGPGFLRELILPAEVQILLDALLRRQILLLLDKVVHFLFIFTIPY